MEMALELALRAQGRTHPNPMVGAVVVKGGRVISKGYHKRAGGAHAEISALKKAGARARGAELYVTLEPCCHHGRTGPCVEAILASGVRRVVAGMRDPNPLVSSKGLRFLKKHGIETKAGVLEADCQSLNEIFIKHITTGRPWVILKAAMSLDGKIASRSGNSKWITGDAARRMVHEIRDRVDAILVGAGTVVKDNPLLTTRLSSGKGKNPIRVILDHEEIVPLRSRVFQNSRSEGVIYVAGESMRLERRQALERKGVVVMNLKVNRNGIPLKRLMRELGKREICSLLIEGGSEVHASALKEKIVDQAYFFIAPKIIGGKSAPGPVGGEGVLKVRNALPLKNLSFRPVGDDWLAEARF
ncbi:MAG: bifunctional diaminohydroxyphosphoribosylaminopyrimidine deaminase/5-amino-6-(5-phosphoribosylamino)uracil reductase RibD [Candidatus Nitrohelix vancouverensis]|uniref:Riboflavin biosynthesis protein RibD n=1 Tax=Candidatus Nitrohelix vancouverensis TaxID=2705534 RepID=A0A7T0G4Y1_9BACT|nr:MAG: bifunctional diaminohydroxyphosphoribosylaminopyrimidine deaminase/5-amino-6-(5-phosphoribosylamino)uracil reductase RibD [Candidatus Nitrohelix vancouverensis]